MDDKDCLELAIFSNNKNEILKKYINEDTIIIKNKESYCPFNVTTITFDYVCKHFSSVLDMIKDKLVVLYDIDKLYKYDCELTRFFCNIASKETKRKIICGKKMTKGNNYDIFSYYFFLNKKIIGVNHYWCFKANHFEKSKFNGEPVRMLDEKYLAQKIAPYTIFDKRPEGKLEEAVYEVVSSRKCL